MNNKLTGVQNKCNATVFFIERINSTTLIKIKTSNRGRNICVTKKGFFRLRLVKDQIRKCSWILRQRVKKLESYQKYYSFQSFRKNYFIYINKASIVKSTKSFKLIRLTKFSFEKVQKPESGSSGLCKQS